VDIRMQSEDVLQGYADSLERLMVSTLNGIMRRVAASVGYDITAAAGSAAEEPLRAAEAQWMEAVGAGFFPRIVEAFHTSAEFVYDQVVDAYDGPAEDVPFVSNEFAVSYLTDTANRMVATTEGTWARARAQLIEGFSAGESIEELSSRLMTISDWSERRAATVARTEIIAASNAGSLAEMRAFQPDASKVWLATMDSRTREAHREADGETVLLDGTFTVGGEELDFPGDPSGSPENVINCRCSLLYNVPRESLQTAIAEMSELPDVTDEFDPEDFVDWDTLVASLEFARKPFEESKHNRGKGGKFAPKAGGRGKRPKINYRKAPKAKPKISYVKPAKKSAPAKSAAPAPAKKTAPTTPAAPAKKTAPAVPAAPAKKTAAPVPAKKAVPPTPPPAPVPEPTPEPVPVAPQELTPNTPLVSVTQDVIDGLDTDSGEFAEQGHRVIVGDRLGTVRHTRTDESGLSDELFVQFDDNPTEVESVSAGSAEVIEGADDEEVLNQPFDVDAVNNLPSDYVPPGEPRPSTTTRGAPFEISSDFDTMDEVDAQNMQDEMLADDPWSGEQETALVTYSGDAYRDMNGCLRFQQGCSDTVESYNDNASAAMRPTTRPTTTFRGANFAALGVENHEQLQEMIGGVVSDSGFTSTSISPETFDNFTGDVALQIEVPEGTPAAYIDQISEFGSNSDTDPPERELLLDRSTRFEILEVGRSNGRSTVRIRVIP
jgi:hypothetical protein